MAGWGYRGDHPGPCLIHGQTNRYSFFRGGGLGGRPRTPHDMPLWGRPSGARKVKGRRERDTPSRQRGDPRRFREIDSEEDDGKGFGLDHSFVSDELFFTGADLGSQPRNRRVHSHDYTSESSEDEEHSNDGYAGGMQLVLRDKEELLVQKALERIRRAQMLGKKNVMLTQPEIDALARKRLKDEAALKATASSSRTAERRRSGVRLNETARNKTKTKRISTPLMTYDNNEIPSPELATPPGIYVPGPDGNLTYQPFNYPIVSQRPSNRFSRSGSGSISTQSQQQSIPPLRPSQFHPPEVRYGPISEASRRLSKIEPNPLLRRLPDDPKWTPRPRSASSQTYQSPLLPGPPQYSQARRNVSGPPSTHSLSSRKGDPPPMPHASSEPSLPHGQYHGHTEDDYLIDSDDLDVDDEEDYGVQVDVVSYGQSYGITERPEECVRERPRRGIR